MNTFKPEGCLFRTAANQKYISTLDGLTEAMEKGTSKNYLIISAIIIITLIIALILK